MVDVQKTGERAEQQLKLTDAIKRLDSAIAVVPNLLYTNLLVSTGEPECLQAALTDTQIEGLSDILKPHLQAIFTAVRADQVARLEKLLAGSQEQDQESAPAAETVNVPLLQEDGSFKNEDVLVKDLELTDEQKAEGFAMTVDNGEVVITKKDESPRNWKR